MMHSSTSPQYAVIASNEVAAAMMEGAGGLTLTTEAIREAVAFRQAVGRIGKQAAQQGGWFFRTWNADTVRDPVTGTSIPFEEAPEDLLAGDPDCWVLHPGDSWHGFDDLEDGYCMLDPIKVSVLTPGVAVDGTLEDHGIPAPLVAAFLEQDGIVVEKTTDFTLLFLFSIGVTRGKWGTLVHALLEFTSHYDANTPLAHVLPTLVAAHGERYAGLGLRDLAEEMSACMRESQKFGCLARTFAELPRATMTPAQAYRRLVHGEVESVPLPRLAERIVATGVVPYPPGIPMLMPGESTGPQGGPVLAYLQALQEWDGPFPGFVHDIHGVESREGTYFVSCLT